MRMRSNWDAVSLRSLRTVWCSVGLAACHRGVSAVFERPYLIPDHLRPKHGCAEEGSRRKYFHLCGFAYRGETNGQAVRCRSGSDKVEYSMTVLDDLAAPTDACPLRLDRDYQLGAQSRMRAKIREGDCDAG